MPVDRDSAFTGFAASRLRLAMGTWVAIDAHHERESELLPAIEAAFAALVDVERLMHPTRAGSDIAKINAARVGLPIEVHAWTWDVLRLAWEIHAQSEGVFDPCLPTCTGRLSDVELTASCELVCREPVALDLGGIAKGYAVDRAVTVLRAHGCASVLINAGGDVRVFGAPRVIALRLEGAGAASIELQDEALAVSDTAASGRPIEHRGYYDRRSGQVRASERSSAAVVARQAALADALTKCALLCETTLRDRVLRSYGARLPA